VVNLGLALNQVVTNTALKPGAFEVKPPPDAKPMTVDELRRQGPLADVKKKPEAGKKTPQDER
jgi:hypothetical protein